MNNKATPASLNESSQEDTPRQYEEDLVLDGIPISQLRSLSLHCRSSSPSMAVFYASLVYSKTFSLDDALLYAQALQQNKEHRRCVALLTNFLQPPTLHLEAVLVATQSLACLEDWQSALDLTQSAADYDDTDEASWQALASSVTCGGGLHPVSRLAWWRGRCYDEMGHPARAGVYWKRALSMDPHYAQALFSLLDRHILSPSATLELVNSLVLDQSMEWLRRLYLARIDLFPSPEPTSTASVTNTSTAPFYADTSVIPMATTPSMDSVEEPVYYDKDENTEHNQKGPPPAAAASTTTSTLSLHAKVDDAFDKLWTVHKLDQSPETLALAAVRSYRRYDWNKALSYCQKLTSVDPLCPDAAFCHVATLLALDQRRTLFGLAHEWVEAVPKSARAWFAVGTYYYACGRYHVAQKHYCRATRLEPQSTESWIAFGCAFAVCDESDQALASFRAAQRLAPAQHIPLLYMGMEYLRTNHLTLAQHFLTSAYKASGGGGDPLCLHELGVAAYQRCDYNMAMEWFTRALRVSARQLQGSDKCLTVEDAMEACHDAFWEPTLFNLGHCHRRMRQFDKAAVCFEKCLALCPGGASSLSALGFTKHLQGDIDGAIEIYHQALSRKPDDPFSSEMLSRALEEALTIKLTVKDDAPTTAAPFSPHPERSVMFRSPLANSRNDVEFSRSKQRSRMRDLNMSMASDGPDLSMESGDMDLSMSPA